MIVSAVDGVYHMIRGDQTMSLILWERKSFPVTNMQMLGSVLFLYSPQTESVYTFGDRGPQRLINTSLGPSEIPGVFTSDGFLAAYGNHTVILIDLPNRRVNMSCSTDNVLAECIYVSTTQVQPGALATGWLYVSYRLATGLLHVSYRLATG